MMTTYNSHIYQEIVEYFKWHQKIIGEIQIQYRWRQAMWRARKQQKERKERWDRQ